jgi:hypothetical protein
MPTNERKVRRVALISCPECQSQISDQADSCPNCGAPAGPDTEVVIIRSRNLVSGIRNDWQVFVDNNYAGTLRNGERVRVARRGGFRVNVEKTKSVGPIDGRGAEFRVERGQRVQITVVDSLTGLKAR